MNKGKNVKIWCGRSDLIGDTVTALPMLYFLEKEYPDSYKYWSILKKCSQAAPLYFNHPLIDKVVISDLKDGFGCNDRNVASDCDLVINTRPQHQYDHWYNKYHMVKETWLMAGLPEAEFDAMSDFQKTPRLYQWWDSAPTGPRDIAIHCFAGYGRDNHRSPSKKWWEDLICLLWDNNYVVHRLGHPKEPEFFQGLDCKVTDLRHLSFMEQVQYATSCRAYIGTDSGFSLVVGAYSHPQVTLLTNWNVNHTKNPYALAPINKNNISIFNHLNENGCSGINKESVLESIEKLL